MAPGLGLVAAQRHRAPAPAPRRRAVVEACRARRRGADADARGLGRSPEHPRGVERHRGERALDRIGGFALAEDGRAVDGDLQLRPRGGVRQPAVDGGHRRRRSRLVRERRLHACVDRLAQLARLAQARAGHVRRCGRELRAHEPQAEVVGRDERLDAPLPALAQRVDEVDRRPSAEPVPPRRAAGEGQRQLLGQVACCGVELHNHMIRINRLRACRPARVTMIGCASACSHVRGARSRPTSCFRLRPASELAGLVRVRRALRARARAGLAGPHRGARPRAQRVRRRLRRGRAGGGRRDRRRATSARSRACRSRSRTTARSRASG